MTNVLITGATGEVAQGVVPMLRPHFHLRLLSLDAKNDPEVLQVDLLDWKALEDAMQGMDVVLHLAVASGHSGTFEDDRFNDLRFDVNVKGTWHVFETARRAQVRRVIYVSSLMVVWGHDTEAMVPGDAPAKPIGTYALTKMLGEDIARQCAEAGGMEVITLRITAPLDVNDPALNQKPVRPQQIPFPDLAQAFQRAITVPLTDYHVVTVTGESSRRRWDLEPAKSILGYEPTVNLDDIVTQWAEPFDVNP